MSERKLTPAEHAKMLSDRNELAARRGIPATPTVTGKIARDIQRELREGTPDTPGRIAAMKRADAAYAGDVVSIRDGHVWCLLHETWWKFCPCPGQFTLTYRISKADLEQARANPIGLVEFVEDQI